MRIVLKSDGSEYEGTPLEIVVGMQQDAFFQRDGKIEDYIAFACGNLHRWFGVQLVVTGKSDEELAESFVGQMLAREFALQRFD